MVVLSTAGLTVCVIVVSVIKHDTVELVVVRAVVEGLVVGGVWRVN